MTAKHYPTKAELADWIRDFSRVYYEHEPTWAVGIRVYNLNKPDDWPWAPTALTHRGYKGNGAGWQQFVDDTLQLYVPKNNEGSNYTKIHNPSTPSEFLPEGIVQTGNTYGYSLKCKRNERTEPVRMWDPYRSRSVLVPASTVYQVV